MHEGGFLYCPDCKHYVPGPGSPELCPAVSDGAEVSACVCFGGHTGGHVFARAIKGEAGCAGAAFHEGGMGQRGKEIGRVKFGDDGARPPTRAEAGALWAYLAVAWSWRKARRT